MSKITFHADTFYADGIEIAHAIMSSAPGCHVRVNAPTAAYASFVNAADAVEAMQSVADNPHVMPDDMPEGFAFAVAWSV